jgi:hypothetical protein
MSAIPGQPPPGRLSPWPSRATAVFHITHVDNIARMAGSGVVKCDNMCTRDAMDPVSIAYAELKEKRTHWPVDVARGGTLADYVPFYYAPRSPMLYVISKGYVASYSGGQAEVAHLIFGAEDLARPDGFVITDGHAATPLTKQFGDLARLDQVDWPVMRDRYWFDTDDDGDRKRRRQAEFLVWGSVPFTAVKLIGVMTQAVAQHVRQGLAVTPDPPEVVVRPDWYY